MTNAVQTFRKYQYGVESYVDEQNRLHSPDNDTPARTSFTPYGQPLHEFYRFGVLHRDNDLPAFEGIVISSGGAVQLRVAGWFINGLAHREGDYPSAVEHNLSTDVVTVSYSKNGILHRDRNKGPAVYTVQLAKIGTNHRVLSAQFFENGKSVEVKPSPLVTYDRDLKTFVGTDVRCASEIYEPKPIITPHIEAADKVKLAAPEVKKGKGGRPPGSKNKPKV